MIGSQFDGPVHHLFRRQVADGALGIPLLDGAEAGYPLRFSLGDDVAVVQLLDEARKAVHAVRIDAGFGGAGKHFCAGIGGFCGDTPCQQYSIECLF